MVATRRGTPAIGQQRQHHCSVWPKRWRLLQPGCRVRKILDRHGFWLLAPRPRFGVCQKHGPSRRRACDWGNVRWGHGGVVSTTRVHAAPRTRGRFHGGNAAPYQSSKFHGRLDQQMGVPSLAAHERWTKGSTNLCVGSFGPASVPCVVAVGPPRPAAFRGTPVFAAVVGQWQRGHQLESRGQWGLRVGNDSTFGQSSLHLVVAGFFGRPRHCNGGANKVGGGGGGGGG